MHERRQVIGEMLERRTILRISFPGRESSPYVLGQSNTEPDSRPLRRAKEHVAVAFGSSKTPGMKSLTEYLWFEVPNRRRIVNITRTVENLVRKGGVQKVL